MSTEKDVLNLGDEEFEKYMNSGALDEQVEDEIEAQESIEEEEQLEADESKSDMDSTDTKAEEPIDSEIGDVEETEDSKEEQPEDLEEIADVDDKDKKEDITDNVETKEVWEPLKAVGTEIPINSKDELYAFAKMGVDYTQKTQALKPHRQKVEALIESGIDMEQLNVLIDASKGNKEAILSLAKKAEIDPLEIDFEDINYTPSNYAKSDEELDLNDTIEQISKDPEFSMTQEIVSKQWDGESREVLAKNPSVLKLLHEDIKTGRFEKYIGLATKQKMMDGGAKSDLAYAIEAAKAFDTHNSGMEAKRQQELARQQSILDGIKTEQANRTKSKTQAKSRKAATITKTNGTPKDTVDYLKDIDSISDEDFDKFMNDKILS